ncbi:hypothetical protein O6H91_02G148300 [Diphasiastrum complanatum]|uniref:Uncharacterized protein n=1 Tax=Diphasiastrum complanatum TaxID=34168 RepID=A0ACC2ELU8_DIPCM|nr:hypothetical protein O6H91_02G148300 [Diphasiastrum complanatum]
MLMASSSAALPLPSPSCKPSSYSSRFLPSSSSSSSIHGTLSCSRRFLHVVHWLGRLTVLPNRAAMVSLVPSPEAGCRKPLLFRHSAPLRANRISVDKASPEEDEMDEDLRTGLNEISTEAVKVMLSDNKRLLNPFKEKVEHVIKYLMQEGHLEAANFVAVIRGMLEHKVILEKDDLKGMYKKAFEKIWAVMEDSGWLLTLRVETSAVEMVDEELIPPVLDTQY